MRKRTFRSQVYYAENIERVWRALTDPAELSQWLTKGNFKAKQGHRFKWIEVNSRDCEPKGSHGSKDAQLENATCEIQEVEAPRRLVYRLEHSMDTSSVVTWSLDTQGEGTQLIIEQEIVVHSDTDTQLRLHPNVVSLATYRRQRSLLQLLGERIHSQKHSHCKEAA